VSNDHKAGPEGDPREWILAHWMGDHWDFRVVTTSTHNYDMGSLYIEPDGTWRIIAPTEPGPQPHGTGGEIALWLSHDEGMTWHKERDITRNSPLNHMYARRPVDAHPDFYALWGDGNPDTFSESHLYFTNRDGTQVWRLPYNMDGDFAEPEPIY